MGKTIREINYLKYSKRLKISVVSSQKYLRAKEKAQGTTPKMSHLFLISLGLCPTSGPTYAQYNHFSGVDRHKAMCRKKARRKKHNKKNCAYFYSKRKKTSTEIRAENNANLCTIEGSR